MQQPKRDSKIPSKQQKSQTFNGTSRQGTPASARREPAKISLPKGGGAIQGIGEKFQVNPVTGTGTLTVPIAMSSGRADFTPQLALSYDSGAGNSPFGLGWNVGLPSITRKTQKGLPTYRDKEERDTFLLSGAEDLVPILHDEAPVPEVPNFTIKRYRPRIEGLFARIEKWTKDNGSIFWKSISIDNITTVYGQSKTAQIVDPKDDTRIFEWLIERVFDDKGNIISYEYKLENAEKIPKRLSEEKRSPSAQRYLKRVSYGNTKPYFSGGISRNEPVDWNIWLKGDMEIPGDRPNHWLFELVFDYGEHQVRNGAPVYDDNELGWDCRPDPFSSFRAGFDIRTYRLCQRILQFHHFPELGDQPYLVRSTDLLYQENAIATKLQAVTHVSYRKGEEGQYEKGEMPAVAFHYSEASPVLVPNTIEPDSLVNIPEGIDGSRFRMVDLYGEGVNGVLHQSDEAWYYKENWGDGRFGTLTPVAESPSVANLYATQQQMLDLAGNGRQNLVIQSKSLNGFFEIQEDGHCKNFQTFEQIPDINWQDPNLRLIDLTGDGHADIMITEGDCILWSKSLAKKGFEAFHRIHKEIDELEGPRIVFNDSTQSIHLTDMTGDGLIDIVRIKNGNVCYWPNLGYGNFGARIQMDDPPVMDHQDLFDPRSIRLADIDGSGATDIIYLGKGKVTYWRNESGNGWGEAYSIPSFPFIDNLASVQVTDLLGKGTAQLVWSSSTLGQSAPPLRYIDLMPEKPHLLVGIDNNMGAITKLAYKASTFFYLEDKKAGNPWITRIPFPVHVLVRHETQDKVSGNHFVSRYAYHHGYFDGEEREFRGFGLIEQWDTEDFTSIAETGKYQRKGSNWSEHTDVPPIYTKTWYHTGFYDPLGVISKAYAKEYYDQDPQHWLLPDSILPSGLAEVEKREACRALKGNVLRQEVYAKDATAQEKHPYTVTEANYTIQCLQRKSSNRHAIFLVSQRENLTYHYERIPKDPRVAHKLNLLVDRYGNSTHTLSLVYPRRGAELPQEQQRLYATLSENLFLHPDWHTDWYRHSVPSATSSFEVHGLESDYDGEKFNIDGESGLFNKIAPFFADKEATKHNSWYIEPTAVLDHSASPSTGGSIQLRLLANNRIKYLANDLTTILPFGDATVLQSLCLPYENYTLAFTKSILDQPVLNGLVTKELLSEGGYVKAEPALFGDEEDQWWIPSGQTLFFYPEELPDATIATRRFYQPIGERTPLGQDSFLWFDHSDQPEASYFLFVEKAADPLNNTLRMLDFDYRTLQPKAILDINGNRSEVAFDIRGMVIATALMGKGNEGDELVFQELNCQPYSSFMNDIFTKPESYIDRATTWFHYDLFAWQRDKQPTFAIGLNREIHYHQAEGENSRVQQIVTYSDGFGREVLNKMKAAKGMAPTYEDGRLLLDEYGKPILSFANDRWVGSGAIVFNNKGKPVKQYEPFFDSHPYYAEDQAITKIGVSPLLHYDPLERLVQTDMPDGTITKAQFSPWHQVTFDPIDTLTDVSPWYQEKRNSKINPSLLDRYSHYSKQKRDRIVQAIVESDHTAAQKSLALAQTPTWQFFDTLGRPFVSITHNKVKNWLKEEGLEEQYFIPNRTEQDILGNPLRIYDGRRSQALELQLESMMPSSTVMNYRGNQVMAYAYAMNGLQLYQNSMDAGEQWTFSDVMGNVLHSWSYQRRDEQGKPEYLHTWADYDALQRPTHSWIQRQGKEQKLVERMIYGEEHPHATHHNLRGALLLHLDGAGLTRNTVFDFKNNLLESSRFLAKDYRNTEVNWLAIPVHDWIASDPNRPISIEPRRFHTVNTYDALDRIITTQSPDGNKTRYTFNTAGLLETVQGDLVKLDSEEEGYEEFTFVEKIDYNARGQRTRIRYGNQVTTRYYYDPKTFRLERLWTFRNDQSVLQDITYTYDAAGNITQIYDIAQPTVFLSNSKVEPKQEYSYDGLYQLIEARGRESRLIHQPHGHRETIPNDLLPNIPLSDTQLRLYREYYAYDDAGNILSVQHVANNGSWTRNYTYLPDSNRLAETQPAYCEANTTYPHDERGNIIAMPHLHQMTWDYKDQLKHADLIPTCATDLETSGTGQRNIYFVYDAKRQRVRKRYLVGVQSRERIYLGAFECYRLNDQIYEDSLQTLHIMDDKERVCLVETTQDGKRFFRYQLGNHLGSVSLEVDETDAARIISYEEYHPYGTSALRAQKSGLQVSTKRYRYTGMERDEETGLNYHGARYYASWLGRWCSADVSGLSDGFNLFEFVKNVPSKLIDKDGRQAHEDNIFVLPSLEKMRQDAVQEKSTDQESSPRSAGTERTTPLSLERNTRLLADELQRLRTMYKEGILDIYEAARMAIQRGDDISEVAEKVVDSRNFLKQLIRADSWRVLKYVAEIRNLMKYDNPIGPIRAMINKSDEEIIEGVLKTSKTFDRLPRYTRNLGKYGGPVVGLFLGALYDTPAALPALPITRTEEITIEETRLQLNIPYNAPIDERGRIKPQIYGQGDFIHWDREFEYDVERFLNGIIGLEKKYRWQGKEWTTPGEEHSILVTNRKNWNQLKSTAYEGLNWKNWIKIN